MSDNEKTKKRILKFISEFKQLPAKRLCEILQENFQSKNVLIELQDEETIQVYIKETKAVEFISLTITKDS